MNPHFHSTVAATIYEIIAESKFGGSQEDEAELAILIADELERRLGMELGRRK